MSLQDHEYYPDNQSIHPESGTGWHQTIRASAGSGKTYQLSTRYLSLIRRNAQPSEVLATTFTRKAAGEVLGRVITRIADAVVDQDRRQDLATSLEDPTLTQADCRAMLRGLTLSLHRLSISTIDGFFNRMAQSFRYELDLPAEPKLIDAAHPVAVRLRREAIESMLADDDLPTLVTLLRQLHHDAAARSVTEAIDSAVTGLYEVYRESPQHAVWSRLEPLGRMDDDQFGQAVAAMEDAAAMLPTNKHWLNAYNENRNAVAARDWKRFISKGLAKKIVEGGETFQRQPITGEWFDVYEPLIGHASGELIHRVAKQTLATHDLLKRFDEHYAPLRRRQGVLLFSDITYKLAHELPTSDDLMQDVYFRLDGRVTHLLLDEFQDTSLSQWDVLRPFAEEIAATSDGSRTLFCVGDTKQAIYGWRGGVAELFDKFEDSLGLDETCRLTMSESYRSSTVILEAVNRVFADIAENPALLEEGNPAKRWQNGFELHKAVRDLPGHVTLETSTAGYNPDTDSDDDDAGGDDAIPMRAGAHEMYVAQRVKALYERNGGAGSIGVLVSRNKSASRLIYELGKLGLPVSGEGGSRLTDSPVVMAILSALVMADHPGDKASSFHVLNSPLGQVVGLASTDKADVRRASLRIRLSLLTDGYAKTIAGWAQAVAPSCDARSVKRLTQLIELADRSEPNDPLRPSWFVDLVESASVAEPSQAPIRVMTIHGSKGLEFDTVVLAELDRRLTDRSVMLIEREDPTGPITGVYRNADRVVRELDEKLKHTAESQRESRIIEDLCSLYVAMTRARQAMHMIVTSIELTKTGKPRSKGLCFASILREALGEVEETLDGEQVLCEIGNADWVYAGGSTSSIQPQPPNTDGFRGLDKPSGDAWRSWPTVAPSSQAGSDGNDESKQRSAAILLDITPQDNSAMRYGTLVHEWMRLIGFIDQDALPTDDALMSVANCVMPNAEPEWIASRIEWLRQLLQGDVAQSILSRNDAADLWRERGFAVQDKGQLLQGFFDRVTIYRDGQGRVNEARLIDYKTDRLGAGGESAIATHYRPQMRVYQRALIKMLGLERQAVTLRLWLVGDDQLIEL